MITRTFALSTLAGALLMTFGAAQAAGDKIVIAKQADLPRFTYKIPGTATRFVEADPAAFNAFAAQVDHDVESILEGYQIDDKSTLIEMLSAKLSYQEIAGDYAGGLKTIEALRALQTKPAAKLLTATPGGPAISGTARAIAALSAPGPAFCIASVKTATMS